MATDREKMETIIENAYVLVSDTKISSMQDSSALEQVLQSTKPLLIVAEDLEDEVTTNLVLNKLRGTLMLSPLKHLALGIIKKNATRHCGINWRNLFLKT